MCVLARPAGVGVAGVGSRLGGMTRGRVGAAGEGWMWGLCGCGWKETLLGWNATGVG